jgi:hypothetical protein
MAPQDGLPPSHSDAPTRPTVELLLNAWRAAERRVAETDPGTPARAAAEIEVEACRTAYQAFQADARSTGDLARSPRAGFRSSPS